MPYATAYQAPRRRKAKARPKGRARASVKSGGSRRSTRSRGRARASAGKASRARATGKRSKSATRGAAKKRVTYVYRYNPASSSGRAVRVRSDSPEALDWPSRKPISQTVAGKRAIQSAEKIVPRVLPAVVAGAAAGGRKVIRAVAPVALAAGQGAVAAALGAAAYVGTKYVLDQYASGAADPAYIVSMAALHARRDAQAKLGRALTSEEIKALRERIAKTYAMQEAVTRGAVPLGLGQLVNLLQRAL